MSTGETKQIMKKIAFHNLGCKVNSYETEAMTEQMRERGYEIVPFDSAADIYVVNTCTVTAVADKKSRQMLHRAKRLNPDALVVAVGCYVQANAEKVLEDPAVDLVIGNDRKGSLADLIEAGLSDVTDIGASGEYESLSIDSVTEHTRAFIKIQDGCDQFCTYCLIPYVRGRIRSRGEQEIVDEAVRLSENGFSEIVLTGIHVSSYGTEDGSPWGPALLRLIRRLNDIPGIRRIRLSSLEPRIITKEFAEGLKSCDKICPHFHLSLQSGCDSVLKRMNRHYTAAEYAESCRILREVFDHPAICTDVITGFPGETEEEFAETVRFLEEISLYEMHIFPYSKRQGTKAAKLPGQLTQAVKAQRSRVLLDMTARQAEEFRAYYEGRPCEVLLEEEEVTDGQTYLTGYTREYITRRIPAEGHKIGDIVYI